MEKKRDKPKKTVKVKKREGRPDVSIQVDGEGNKFGGLPNRDLKKNLGCG